MALTAAEKQRRYREKRDMNPERRVDYLIKSKIKYKEDVSIGKRKKIGDMTKREKKLSRRQWSNRQQVRRTKMKDNNMTKLLTPPNSPDYHEPSRQSNSASKLRNRNKATCYRDNEKLKNEITAMERRVTVYRKRWLWIKKRRIN